MRSYSTCDQIILNIDIAIKTLFGKPLSSRANPASPLAETQLDERQRRQIAAFMRVNHAGEVCAQALYQGQALTAQQADVQKKLERAAEEEIDHLVWCQERIHELHSHTSYLNPFWYSASLIIGMLAGLAGDKISLGFLAETEHQVEQHLSQHLKEIPSHDKKTRAILEKMRQDEMQHALIAEQNNAASLPPWIKSIMHCLSKVMTTSAYWI